MLYAVDRIEEDIAVLEEIYETGETFMRNIPLTWLPDDLQEGDILRKTKDGYVIDKTETAKRRRSNASLMKQVTDDA